MCHVVIGVRQARSLEERGVTAESVARDMDSLLEGAATKLQWGFSGLTKALLRVDDESA